MDVVIASEVGIQKIYVGDSATYSPVKCIRLGPASIVIRIPRCITHAPATALGGLAHEELDLTWAL